MTTPISTLPLAQDIGYTTGTITGRWKAADGSVSSPGIQFRDDPNTGIYRIGADNIGFAVLGFRALDISSAAMTLGVNLQGNGQSILGWRFEVIPRTADLTLNSGANCSRLHTNTGASGEVIFALPASTTGARYTFAVDAAQYLRIKAEGSDTIRDVGTVSAGAGYIRSNVAGSTIEIACVASGKWYVMSKQGTWTVDS